jgi:hypothetical protein
MERELKFKRFENSRPVNVAAAQVKANPESWEFVEVGANMEKADPMVLKAISTGTLQADRKVISPEEYQQVLGSVTEGAEMLKQLTAFRALLIQKGYKVEGQIALSHSVSDGTDWINARLYRQVKRTPKQANEALLATL